MTVLYWAIGLTGLYLSGLWAVWKINKINLDNDERRP